MTILVTGGQGYLGRHLCAEIRRRRSGARLIVLGRRSAPGIVGCDLRDRNSVNRVIRRFSPAVIFHLAGLPLPRPWTEVWDASVATTINLLDSVRTLTRFAAVKVIVAGSIAEYGLPKNGRALTESAPARPVTQNGAIKLSQTLAALSYAHQGLAVTVARIANPIGPGIPESLAAGSFAGQLARMAQKGGPGTIRVGNLFPVRDFLDVRDVARALILLARHGAPNEIYNVASGRGYSVGNVLDALISISGVRAVPRVDVTRRRSEAYRIVGDSSKLRKATGWRPTIPLESSLQDVWSWWRLRSQEETA